MTFNEDTHSPILPSYRKIKEQLKLSQEGQHFIVDSRRSVESILQKKDPRRLLIIGPCSVHDVNSTLEFAKKLQGLQKEVQDQFFILMRVHCEKPRTQLGWKGFLYDPLLDGSHDILRGIQLTRSLLVKINEMEVPAATEFLDPLTAYYHDDLISWGAIGARTTTSQPHRQLASTLSMPIGFKNDLSGQIKNAIDAITYSHHSHSFIIPNEEGFLSIHKSEGNKNNHLILRGGDSMTNYDKQSIQNAKDQLRSSGLKESIVIDCSHGNSQKNYLKQKAVFHDVIQQILEGEEEVRGLMLESHLFEGKQPHSPNQPLQYGISITDSCLGWADSEELILKETESLRNQQCALL